MFSPTEGLDLVERPTLEVITAASFLPRPGVVTNIGLRLDYVSNELREYLAVHLMQQPPFSNSHTLALSHKC